jgi:hypothetical protein
MSRWRAAALAALIGACGDGEPGDRLLHINGTTNRISEFPTIRDGTDLTMKIYTQTEDCEYITTTKADAAACMPYVDRASGEVRLSFSLLRGDNRLPMPLTEDHVRVLHDNVHIRDGQVVDLNGSESYVMGFDLIPHREVDAEQLFILVIDGSTSMSEPNSEGVSRIAQVRSALLSSEVRNAFFPTRDVRTGVVIYSFSKGDPRPISGQIEILESKGEYDAAIREHLVVPGGFTHMYNAVRYATSTLLEEEPIETWLDLNNADPTVIVLTDGFNNTNIAERCADNVPDLQSLLKHLQKSRRNSEHKPRVYTVGLGLPIRANYTLPNERGTDISVQELCARFANVQIDRNLENRGIDNVSLEWIAAYGGGNAYVRQGRQKLGEAFRAAAAKRYMWFEARYRVHPSFLRRRFVTAIELVSFATAQAEVTIHPSAWLDAPPGALAADGWTRPASFRGSLGIVLPTLGLVVMLMYFGAASFNSRRVIFGRMRPPRPPKDNAS